MAESNFPTRQYPSSDFVESCGAIIFDLSHPSRKRVCLSNTMAENKWILVKGRRNINESREDTAQRELYEETGYRCKLLPVRMPTRATTAHDPPDVVDHSRVHDGLMEPFMFTLRDLPSGNGVKIIWWFIAVLDVVGDRGPGEQTFRSEFFDYDEAIEKLWFETDREILRRAVEIVEGTMAREA
jgi:8-oxo-dGTP pyrophosphatase MutT (NUDIX family)